MIADLIILIEEERKISEENDWIVDGKFLKIRNTFEDTRSKFLNIFSFLARKGLLISGKKEGEFDYHDCNGKMHSLVACTDILKNKKEKGETDAELEKKIEVLERERQEEREFLFEQGVKPEELQFIYPRPDK